MIKIIKNKIKKSNIYKKESIMKESKRNIMKEFEKRKIKMQSEEEEKRNKILKRNTILIKMYFKENKEKKAFEKLKEMRYLGIQPDPHFYSNYINYFIKKNNFLELNNFIKHFKVELNEIHYSFIIRGYLMNNNLEGALKMISEMREKNMGFSMKLLTSFSEFYSQNIENFYKIEKMIEEVKKIGKKKNNKR
jgi:pentatricopeptide repeat protein